jgi:hypothetical protein
MDAALRSLRQVDEEEAARAQLASLLRFLHERCKWPQPIEKPHQSRNIPGQL